MRLHKVFLINFGLFGGENTIDFRGDAPDGRNISLIAGMNGAGKTTFLEAVQLALYGRAALGKRVSQANYLEHLRQRIHRNKVGSQVAAAACVGLEFEHETMGAKSSYRIFRRWSAVGDGAVAEELEILKDGDPLAEVDQQYWQDFIRELVPPGVSQLFFFDGEKIQRLADDEDSEAVAEAIKSLLGLDLVEKLQDDLSIYRDRQLKKTGSKKALRELEDAQLRLAKLEDEMGVLKQEKGDSVNSVTGLNAEVRSAEESLALQGGKFAENREQLKVERALASERLEKAEQTLRELAETALPFAFCPGLSGRLLQQLGLEEEAKKSVAVRSWVSDKLTSLRSRVSDEALKLVESEMLEGLPEPEQPVHGLSADSERLLRTWFEDAEGSLSDKLTWAGSELEEATRSLQAAQKKLRQVPEEDSLKPRVEALNDALSKRAEKELELKRIEERSRSLQLEIDNTKREVQRAEERVELDDGQAKRLSLLERCQGALVSYQQKLTVAKVERLGEEVTGCFHHLHRKGDLVQKIQVDPVTCRVSLFDSDEQILSKKELSAGEKQMYAVAMLWGLARTSGRKLPLIIDTPLGRLDSAHRDNLVERYFPHAADQVIILSTDTEIDKDYYESLAPHIAHAYRLEFNPELARTEIHEGYFWRESETCHA